MSGCGLAEYNGEYVFDGVADGVPCYRKPGAIYLAMNPHDPPFDQRAELTSAQAYHTVHHTAIPTYK